MALVDFVIPSWSYWTEPLRAQPLTQMYLATILEQEGHNILFTDMRDGKKKLPTADAHFYTVASPDFKEVSEIVKENPGYHVAGGPHPSIFPAESLKVFKTIVMGNGEEPIKIIANQTDNIKKYIKTVFDNIPKRGEYPFPRRHFLEDSKIVTSLFKTEKVPSTTVLFSNGCLMHCTFCANYNRQPIQRRSLKNIEREIDYLQSKYGIKGFSLQDEICFPPNKEEEKAFLNLLSNKNMIWRGQTRAGITEDTVERAARSGCLELSIGLESVDQEVLRINKKGIKIQQAEHSLKLCKDYGIKTRIYLLNGLPGEPEDIAEKTKDFINKVNPDVVLLSSLQPYPGSELYEHPERFGMTILDSDASHYNHLRGRFKGSENELDGAVPFEYAKGRGLPRKKILENLVDLQSFLRGRDLNK